VSGHEERPEMCGFGDVHDKPWVRRAEIRGMDCERF
jgi:hypothetical protein